MPASTSEAAYRSGSRRTDASTFLRTAASTSGAIRRCMPKSMIPIRPPSITIRLPGCGSQWKKPSRNIMCRKAREIHEHEVRHSRAERRDGAAASLIFTPSMNSIASTRRVVRSQWMRGTRTRAASSGSRARLPAISSPARPSRR